MVNNRLVHIIETRRLLHPHQFAFRKGKTTVDHLAELEKVVRAAWNKKEYVQGIFLDVTKAYDTTWRRLVLNQLRDWNIEGLMLKFLDRMLENRSFRVFVNGQLSQSKIMETGQGSVLSVTLFLVAINTLVARMPPSITTLLYADDVVLLASGRNVEEVENDLQAALKAVECWQSSTGFKISAEKSATVIFRSYGTRKPPSRAALELNGTLIPTKKQHRCLGVILDQHLLFKTHCEEVKAACRQRVQLIRCNEKADEEAKQSLNDRNIWDRSVEFKEFRTVIKKRTVWRWNAEWSRKVGNKLREVKNSVLPYRDVFVGSRKEDVILTRLRIGHTLLTHQYLLEKDSAPRCTRCNLALTVKHILAECPEFEEQRRRAGVTSNVREALADDRDMAKNLLKFLKATDMYGKV
ncbi:hypothetical protein quinque_009772 [Culex quinquefasciatus]